MTDEQFITLCNSADSMSAAAAEMKISLKTLRSRATKLGCYRPNQGGKGTYKKSNPKYELQSILEGRNPSFQTNHLRRRLLKSGILKNRCAQCGIEEWQSQPIVCELDHINGDRTDHRLDNIRLLCPNCHSQTSTYRGRNIKKNSGL